MTNANWQRHKTHSQPTAITGRMRYSLAISLARALPHSLTLSLSVFVCACLVATCPASTSITITVPAFMAACLAVSLGILHIRPVFAPMTARRQQSLAPQESLVSRRLNTLTRRAKSLPQAPSSKPQAPRQLSIEGLPQRAKAYRQATCWMTEENAEFLNATISFEC